MLTGLYRIIHIKNDLTKKSVQKKAHQKTSFKVGMTGFEPATPRPPDVYSNRTELHPENIYLNQNKSIKN